MRAQCAVAKQEAASVPSDSVSDIVGSIHKYYSSGSSSTAGSSDSLSSTNTATPEDDSCLVLRSPSEGYKSAYGSSELNMADDESDFTDSRSSSCSDLSIKNSAVMTPAPRGSNNGTGGLSPPSLQDFKASLNLAAGSCSKVSLAPSAKPTDCTKQSLSSSSMTESMFTSVSSVKSEALKDKVRKLCLSTSNLNEKMRLARMESRYIHV